MGKYTGKHKGKRGKIDYIEDIIGTEPLSGTYKERDKMAKKLRNEKMLKKAQEDVYLRGVRKKREEEIMLKLMDVKKNNSIEQKIGYVLKNVLEPSAYEYINIIRQMNQELCHKICYCLFPPDTMLKLDSYVQRILTHGPPREKIKLSTILKYERAIKGIKPSIKIEEDGIRIDIKDRISGRKVV